MDGPTNRARIYLLEEDESGGPLDGLAVLGPDGGRDQLPPLVHEAVMHVIEAMRAGMGVKISPLRPELPVDEAAAAIGMHADTFRKYVASGAVPFRSTEQVDWVRLSDVIAFSRAHKEQRREGMRQLSGLMDDPLENFGDDEPDTDGRGT